MAIHPRSAANVLARIAAYMELQGENKFKARAYETAATAIGALALEDLTPSLESGELGAMRGLGPATLAVIRDLADHGQSRMLEQLRQTTPEGLLDLLRVPGLTPGRIREIHDALHIESLDELERAARDGRLERLPKVGPKTAAKILSGIAALRSRGKQRLYTKVLAEAERFRAAAESHPHVTRAIIAGPLRRHCETVGHVDIVAACTASPEDVAATFTGVDGVAESTGSGAFVQVLFVDGTTLRLHCARERDFGAALVVATGSDAHVEQLRALLAERGFDLAPTGLTKRGKAVAAPNEDIVYKSAGLATIDPAMREGRGEIAIAAAGPLPTLIENRDIRGVLHCHTIYSDGKATVAEMARAAAERGWSYVGISDHSQAAFYAGGLTLPRLNAQANEIDDFNAAGHSIRVLKGIEADILADGRLDYGPDVLDRFDFVIGSIHSRFSMNRTAMTDRILRAMDEPHLTILGHPTGRRLLAREAYEVDVDAILMKAAERGIAIELNADPRRLDLDWRHFARVKELGVQIAIGPDAHSVISLDNTAIGVGMARKGGLEASDVLNSRSVDDVLAFARARRR